MMVMFKNNNINTLLEELDTCGYNHVIWEKLTNLDDYSMHDIFLHTTALQTSNSLCLLGLHYKNNDPVKSKECIYRAHIMGNHQGTFLYGSMFDPTMQKFWQIDETSLDLAVCEEYYLKAWQSGNFSAGYQLACLYKWDCCQYDWDPDCNMFHYHRPYEIFYELAQKGHIKSLLEIESSMIYY